jgi:mRNA interferase MazF
MKSGKKYNFGDIILAFVQFVDSGEIKTRPAVVLFEEYNNIILAGITSIPHMKGIPLSREEGMSTDSIVKINYIMTIDESAVKKYLFTITEDKKQIIREELVKRLQ